MSFVEQFNNSKNPSHRDQEATAIIGDKRQGKTTLVKLLIDEYIKKYPSRRVLVYDISKAFGPSQGFKGYKTITLDECYMGVKVKGGRRKWKSGVRRLEPNYDHEEVLAFMSDHFRDGLLVIDEATTVMSDNPTDKRKAVMITHTNNRVDIYMIFHSMKYVPKRLRPNFWNYFIFKTGDGFTSADDVAALGFPNSRELYDAWSQSQKAPHRDDQILQFFSIFKRTFQQK